jgi:hypothetical protein
MWLNKNIRVAVLVVATISVGLSYDDGEHTALAYSIFLPDSILARINHELNSSSVHTEFNVGYGSHNTNKLAYSLLY